MLVLEVFGRLCAKSFSSVNGKHVAKTCSKTKKKHKDHNQQKLNSCIVFRESIDQENQTNQCVYTVLWFWWVQNYVQTFVCLVYLVNGFTKYYENIICCCFLDLEFVYEFGELCVEFVVLFDVPWLLLFVDKQICCQASVQQVYKMFTASVQ